MKPKKQKQANKSLVGLGNMSLLQRFFSSGLKQMEADGQLSARSRGISGQIWPRGFRPAFLFFGGGQTRMPFVPMARYLRSASDVPYLNSLGPP